MTVIIAPRDYLETQDGSNLFDVRIPYEDIIAYFEGSRSNDADGVITRSRHRQEMLEQAVHKRRRGYVPTINADVTSFWICYWELAVRVAPSLRLNRPIPKPARSNFVFFNKALEAPPPLRKCKIKHKLELGRVDLEFAGWAERLKRDRPILESFADTDMTLKQRSKSMAFSIEVPKLDTNAAFEPQSELAAFGLQAALRMQKWFQTNCDRLQKYAER